MMKNIKLTPLSVALIILELFLIWFAFYYLCIENKGGMALGGTIAFIAAIVNLFLILIQQAIANINGINIKILSVIEIIIIISVIIYVYKNGVSIG